MDIDEYQTNSIVHQDTQTSSPKVKKTKCHGNRKLQRFKRNYRKQGFNDQTIQMFLAMHQTITSVHQDAQIMYQEKVNDDDDNYFMLDVVSNSNISMPFENQDYPHRDQFIEKYLRLQLSTLFEQTTATTATTTRKWMSSLGKPEHKKVKYPVSTTDHWKQSSKLIPNYLHMHSRLFIHLLSKVIPCHRRHIEQYLMNSELLQFMQQRAQVLCNFFQLKIEQDYWNFVENSITSVLLWLSQFTGNIMKENSINWDHTKTETNIKYRQNVIENKLQQAIHKLYEHMQQRIPHQHLSNSEMENNTNGEQPQQQHSMTILFDALTVLLRNGLQYFLMNFQQKKILLNIDIYDVQLVKSFYDLNPSENQLHIVQQIWQAKVKSYKRTIRQKKKHSSTVVQQPVNKIPIFHDESTTVNDEINELYREEHKHQEDQLSSSDLLTPAMCLLVKARLNNIEQRARHILDLIDVRSE